MTPIVRLDSIRVTLMIRVAKNQAKNQFSAFRLELSKFNLLTCLLNLANSPNLIWTIWFFS